MGGWLNIISHQQSANLNHTMRFYFTATMKDIIKKATSIGKDIEKLEPYTLLVGFKIVQHK